MRFAAALSLSRDLRAAPMPEGEVRSALCSVSRRLQRRTPDVEPAADEPGIFWLDASGLERLYESLEHWAGLVRADLEAAGFHAVVTVGFSRFGTYAVARSRSGKLVFSDPAEEDAAARRVSIERLGLPPAARDALERLGIRDVGGFVDLPVEGIEKRFGAEAYRLHQLASGELRPPLQPDRPPEPASRRKILDHSETDVRRLLHGIESMIGPVLETLASRGQALTLLHVGFRFERLGDHVELIRPAAPTLDAAQLLELTRLRLESLRRLPDGVTEILLVSESTTATRQQLQLFARRSRRDLAAANRGLARVRAELGDDAVVRARLREGHLPEAGFGWETVEKLPEARPRDVESGRLVRRIFSRPMPLPARPRHEPDGWMLRGLQQGPVVRVLGPYVVSGGWWRKNVHREYHFAETQKGEMLWVYYDRPRRRWFLQGRVE